MFIIELSAHQAFFWWKRRIINIYVCIQIAILIKRVLFPNVWTTQIVGFNGLVVGEAIPILVSLCFGHLDPVPLSRAA